MMVATNRKPKPSISEELMTAAGVKPANFKVRQKLLEKVFSEIDKLSEEEWQQLSQAAQDWHKSNVKNWNDEKPLIDFEPAAEKPADNKAAPKTPPARAAAPAPKPPARVVAPPAKKSNGRGAAAEEIQRLALKFPHIPAQELNEKVKARGHKVSNEVVSAIRSHFRQAVKVLREAGELKHKDLEV